MFDLQGVWRNGSACLSYCNYFLGTLRLRKFALANFCSMIEVKDILYSCEDKVEGSSPLMLDFFSFFPSSWLRY